MYKKMNVVHFYLNENVIYLNEFDEQSFYKSSSFKKKLFYVSGISPPGTNWNKKMNWIVYKGFYWEQAK